MAGSRHSVPVPGEGVAMVVGEVLGPGAEEAPERQMLRIFEPPSGRLGHVPGACVALPDNLVG